MRPPWPALAARIIASAALGGLAALHAAWGAGAAWPCADRAELADVVVGTADVPGPAACLAVSGALGAAAALTAGLPRRHRRMRYIGLAGVTAVLASRGALGLAGRTELVSPGSSSTRFRRLDRRVYSPACLTLAALAALSAASDTGRQRRTPAG